MSKIGPVLGGTSGGGGVTGFATPALTLTTANAAGAATTVIRSDASILTYDATTPAASAVGDAGAVGAAATAARRDHQHPRETLATTKTNLQVDLVTDYTTTVPATPTVGVELFSQQFGARTPSTIQPSGAQVPLAHASWRNTSSWVPDGGGTNVRISRGPTQTVVGTITSVGAVGTGSFLASVGCLVHNPSAAGAGSFSEIRAADQRLFLGNAAQMGGFHWITIFGVNTQASASDRIFVGLSATSGAFANSDPSTLLNEIGVGADAGDTNLQFMLNAGSGTATKTDLGGNYLKAASATRLYEVHVYFPPNSVTGQITILRLDDRTIAPVVLALSGAKVPAVNTLMNWHNWASNNATAAVCDLYWGGTWVENEYF